MPKFSDISESDSDSENSNYDTTPDTSRAGSVSPTRGRAGIRAPDPPRSPESSPSRPPSPALSDFSGIRCSTALSTYKDFEGDNNEDPSAIDEAPPGDNIVIQACWIIFDVKRNSIKLLFSLPFQSEEETSRAREHYSVSFFKIFFL